MEIKLDVLAFAAHPDDVELSCSGTLLKLTKQGKKVGIVDLTQGELGTRGSASLRLVEAQNSSKILGISVRENLNLGDGFFENNRENKIKIIEALRKYKPTMVLANALNDRHIDHGRGARLVADACFLSGLRKIETETDGVPQEAWRPNLVLHYIQDYYMKPNIVVDVTEVWSQKIESINAFSSQFYSADSKEPVTPISGEDFFEFLEGRAKEMGRPVGAKYGEGFVCERPLQIEDLTLLG